MSLPIRTTPEADAQIRDIDDWWRRSRPASPDLFFDELTAAFDIITHECEEESRIEIDHTFFLGGIAFSLAREEL